jgi:phage terminase large subunit-like protein
LLTTLAQYTELWKWLGELSERDPWLMGQETRNLCLTDLYFLLRWGLRREDLGSPNERNPNGPQWLLERCREVQAHPNGHLDLWSREHYKSTVITFALTIQDILRNPEITIGIFSHTRPIAKAFLAQIKREFEQNEPLKEMFSDVLWSNPQRDAPKWSEDDGIIVRRQGNPKEATLEAWGLVDGQPTGRHFWGRIYDDAVTRESVGTPDQIKKTTGAFELSDNLGAIGGWFRMIGTRYSFADTYHTLMERGVVKKRIYPATDNGMPDGTPVLWSPEIWAQKKIAQGPSTTACQLLQNPAAGNEAMFKREWLRFLDIRPSTLNVYIVCDPASSKKKNSDRTAMAVVGLDAAGNRYLLDGFCHKMSLAERWAAFRGLRIVWSRAPGVQSVTMGYEKYGMQSDLEYFHEKMRVEKNEWEILELNWTRDGTNSKVDRVQRLQPYFAAARYYLPDPVKTETTNQRKVREQGQGYRVFSPIRRRDHEGNAYSLVQMLLDEYLYFPFSVHDDLLDAMSRVEDMEPCVPIIVDETELEPEGFSD